MLNNKNFSLIFVVAFSILTYFLYANNDIIANTIATDGLGGVAWYYLSNVNYVLLIIAIIFINKGSGLPAWRALLGALAIVMATDIVGFPRFSPAAFPTDLSVLASSDAIIIKKLMSFGFSYTYVYGFYYLVLPIILMLVALQSLGIVQFTKSLTKA